MKLPFQTRISLLVDFGFLCLVGVLFQVEWLLWQTGRCQIRVFLGSGEKWLFLRQGSTLPSQIWVHATTSFCGIRGFETLLLDIFGGKRLFCHSILIPPCFWMSVAGSIREISYENEMTSDTLSFHWTNLPSLSSLFPAVFAHFLDPIYGAMPAQIGLKSHPQILSCMQIRPSLSRNMRENWA